jgi:predicted ribosome quality control (RQC) complex YloA/Tae2 family protein
MLREMTNVDVLAAVNEIRQQVVGKRFDKFYQHGDNEFFLKFKGNGQQTVLILLPYTIGFTGFTREFKEPTSFAMTVRKYLENKPVTGCEQLSFDRVIKFSTEDAYLIIEFFGKGNLILADKDSKILAALRSEETKVRKIARNEPYAQLPSKKRMPDQASVHQFFEAADKELPIIVNLSRIINFPAIYFNEIFAKEELDPKKKTKEYAPKEIELILKAANEFVQEAGKTPVLFEDGSYSCSDIGLKRKKTAFSSLSELFGKLYSERVKSEGKTVSSARIEKIMKKLKHQQEHLTMLEAEEKETKAVAEMLLLKKETIDQLISAFSKLKKEKDKQQLLAVLARYNARLREGFIEVDF